MDALGNINHVNFLRYAHWFMSIRIYHIKHHYILLYQDRYATFIVAKHLDTATFKASTKFYNTTFPSDMNFPKSYAYTIDNQVEKFTKEINIYTDLVLCH